MDKNLKIIIIGFGSIGQRHYQNLLALGYRNVYVFDNDEKKIKNQKSKIKNLGKGTLKDFDVVFICTPNHLHIKHALLAARAGCHLFIEKPLSHNLSGVERLWKLCQKKKLVNMVACNMRFHPALKFIKAYLRRGGLGKIYSIAHECGHYLPFWRRKSDYRKNYAAKRATGGGIILDDIHEFDLLFWLNNFAPASKSALLFDKVSKLQIDTEDAAVGSFIFQNKVLGLVKADYLQKAYTRRCQIVGQKGTVEWDWSENTVWLRNENGAKILKKIKKFDRNQMYVDEVKYFLNCVETRKKTFNDIGRAKAILTHIL